MLLTSGYNFEGYEILEYVGHESAQIVLGTGFLSSLNSSLADLLGTTSSAYQDKLSVAELTCKQILISKARSQGCNAIIGIDVDYTVFANDIMGVVVGGTLVKIAKKVPEKAEKAFAIGRYNLSHPLRCCNVYLMNMMREDSTYIRISGKFFEKNKIDAIKIDLVFKTLFGESIQINDIIFAEIESTDEYEFSTEYVKLDIDSTAFKVIDYVDVKPTTYVVNKKIIHIDCEQDLMSNASSDALIALRKNNGCEAVTRASKDFETWKCFCGQHNPLTTEECSYCKRTVHVGSLRIVLSKDAQNFTFDYQEHLTYIEKCNTAKEIYEYLSQFSNLDPTIETELLPQLSKLKDIERMYGNKKARAISIVTGIWGVE